MHSGDFFLQINHVDATLLLNILRQTRWTYVSENEKRSNDKQSIFHWKTYTKTALLIKYWLELYIYFFLSASFSLSKCTSFPFYRPLTISFCIFSFLPSFPLSRHLPATSVYLLSTFFLFPPISHSPPFPPLSILFSFTNTNKYRRSWFCVLLISENEVFVELFGFVIFPEK